MKNQKNLTILGGVTVLGIAAAGLALVLGGKGEDRLDGRGPLLPALKERVNDVARVRVAKAGEARTMLLRDGAWTIEECAGYPAEFEKVKEAIFKAAELEVEAVKTKLPSNHAQLGVEGVAAEDSKSTELTFWDAAGGELATVILGESEYRRGGQSTYARRGGEDQVYQCTGRSDFRADVRSWADVSILRIPASRVRSITIEHGDGDLVKANRRPGEGDQFGIANVPGDRTAKGGGMASGLGSAISTLDLEDVRAAGDVEFGGESLVTTEFAVDDGLIIVLRTVEIDDKVWTHVAARFEAPVGPSPLAAEPATPDPAAAEGEDAAGADAEAQAAKAVAEAAALAMSKEADEINARLGPWAFAIPSYRATNLRKSMEEYLEPLAEVPEEGPADLPLELPDENPPTGSTTEGGAADNAAGTEADTTENDG